jgi:hypothetical protein
MARTRKICEPRPPHLSDPKTWVNLDLPKFSRLRTRRRQPGHDFGAAILGAKDHMVTIMAMRANAVVAVAQA